MDASGKPHISRELLRRIESHRSRESPEDAYGITRVAKANRCTNASRRYIKRYVDSGLTNLTESRSAQQKYSPRSDMRGGVAEPVQDSSRASQNPVVKGQNRSPGALHSKSSADTSSATGRQEFNASHSLPRHKFVEPPAREYNPFGS